MKVGDLVRFRQTHYTKRRLGCLPRTQAEALRQDKRWSACGLIQEVCNDGNVNVLWSDRGLELVDDRFLEVINAC